jgi:MSHA biogenesis protein MshP
MTQTTPFSVSARRRSAGVGLVTAIFLLVVLAGLAVAMVAIYNTQQQSSSLDEQGARADQAARAGVEWGVFHRVNNSGCANGSATSFAFPAESVLAPFSVTVECTFIEGPDRTNPDVVLDRWIIRATACTSRNGRCPDANNSPDYVQRVVEVQI